MKPQRRLTASCNVRYNPAAKRAGIRRRNPYHTRHTIFAPAGSEGSTKCKRIKKLTKKSNTT
ncbi:hypothetical protein EJE23_03370 [Enterobacter chengduensis]|nr:hypothetical protein EJE23_03370 [Enterobacter chengduensis]